MGNGDDETRKLSWGMVFEVFGARAKEYMSGSRDPKCICCALSGTIILQRTSFIIELDTKICERLCIPYGHEVV